MIRRLIGVFFCGVVLAIAGFDFTLQSGWPRWFYIAGAFGFWCLTFYLVRRVMLEERRIPIPPWTKGTRVLHITVNDTVIVEAESGADFTLEEATRVRQAIAEGFGIPVEQVLLLTGCHLGVARLTGRGDD
jgi:hypothetical protein